jgi:preprotein translocase subunit YajC
MLIRPQQKSWNTRDCSARCAWGQGVTSAGIVGTVVGVKEKVSIRSADTNWKCSKVQSTKCRKKFEHVGILVLTLMNRNLFWRFFFVVL